MKCLFFLALVAFAVSTRFVGAQGLSDTPQSAQKAYDDVVVNQLKSILVTYSDQKLVEKLDMRPTVMILRGVFDCHNPATQQHRYYIFRLLGLAGFDKVLLDMQKIPKAQTASFREELADLKRARRSFTQWDRFADLEERRFFYEIADQHPDGQSDLTAFAAPYGFVRPGKETKRLLGSSVNKQPSPFDDPRIVATALEPETLPGKWDATNVPQRYRYLVLNLRRKPVYSQDKAFVAGDAHLVSDDNTMQSRADWNDFRRAERCAATTFRSEEKKPFINFHAFFGITR